MAVLKFKDDTILLTRPQFSSVDTGIVNIVSALKMLQFLLSLASNFPLFSVTI